MKEKENKKNKHMTLEDRIEIQECLNKGMTFKAIAQRIGKDPTTVSKEVKLHGKTYTNSFTTTDEICPKLLKAPFVCNACNKKNNRSFILRLIKVALFLMFFRFLSSFSLFFYWTLFFPILISAVFPM